jgi:hypothetical protein
MQVLNKVSKISHLINKAEYGKIVSLLKIKQEKSEPSLFAKY